MLVALFLQVFCLLYSELHLAYIPSGNDTMHGFFETLFSVNGWVTLSSLFAFLSSHMLGVMLFWFIREKSKVSIGVSIFAATSITHILDTITFRLLLGCASLFEIPHFSSFLYQTVDMIIFKSAIAFITGMLISGYLFLSRGRL